MATITEQGQRPRGQRLRWFVGLWLASVLAVLAAAEILRLLIGALYRI